VGNHRERRKPKRLAEKLLAIRLKLEVSQNQLAKLLEFDKGSARLSEYERGIREPDLLTLLAYAKLARVSLDVLADDNSELKFPERWKRPRRVANLLRQQKGVRTQNRIDDLRRELPRNLRTR
jgi:transcriptional regulator with XRE-family HTH domain